MQKCKDASQSHAHVALLLDAEGFIELILLIEGEEEPGMREFAFAFGGEEAGKFFRMLEGTPGVAEGFGLGHHRRGGTGAGGKEVSEKGNDLATHDCGLTRES